MTNRKIKVLLVEDVKIAQMMAKLLLEQLNCDVDTAETGKQALDLADTHTYHIIFMDIGLPDINGIEVTKNIKQKSSQNKDTPIAVLTANIDETVKKGCTDAGIENILAKPLSEEDCEKLFSAANL